MPVVVSVRAGWLPMERVLSGTLQGLNGPDRGRFYAQSWLATHYFYSNAERFGQFGRFLTAIAEERGKAPPEVGAAAAARAS